MSKRAKVPCDGIVMVPMSRGDLVDRITILQVKAERIGRGPKQANVLQELMLLRRARDAAKLDWTKVSDLAQQLCDLHAHLWDVENAFHDCERRKDFGPTFVAAAGAVIRHNTRRAQLKRFININLRSKIMEEKYYA